MSAITTALLTFAVVVPVVALALWVIRPKHRLRGSMAQMNPWELIETDESESGQKLPADGNDR